MMKMKKFILTALVMSSMVACSSKSKKDEPKPLKAENVQTTLDKETQMTDDTSVGVNKDNNVVVQEKTQMAEYLLNLKYESYKEYEALYGIREYGSKGLAGQVDACHKKASLKKFGGDGTAPKLVARPETLKKEMQLEWKDFEAPDQKIGFDEKQALVAVTQEHLRNKVDKFQDYRKQLTDQRAQLEQALSDCQAKIEDAD
jgi:hypothetical protein